MSTEAKSHIDGYATQGIGGWAEYSAWATPSDDPVYCHKVTVPSMKVIPIVFLPGIMGSNLRMSKKRQAELKLPDNRAWRPDDFGKWEAITNSGYVGRVRRASPKQRQKILDPNTTEVEHYSYTSDKDMFDPDGEETRKSDARHKNIPNGFQGIPPLLTEGPPAPADAPWHVRSRTVESAAQKARWRGWSEILFNGAYGELLTVIEQRLNNVFDCAGGPPMKISPLWQSTTQTGSGSNLTDSEGRSLQSAHTDPLALVDVSPQRMGATQGKPITSAQLESLNVHGHGPLWFPVHAMGYNWLKSNGESARTLAERITGLIDGYQKRGFQCEKVIVITHSMGGLVARALIHPDYGNIEDKVLGIYHGAMPTHGAAAAYKRIRCGFESVGVAGGIAQQILGESGKHVTAVMANSPGSLELLPNEVYGEEWLKVVASDGKTVLASWPGVDNLSEQDKAVYTAPNNQPLRDQVQRNTTFVGEDDPFYSYAEKLKQQMTAVNAIYTQTEEKWWRLFNPEWVNPAEPQKDIAAKMDDVNQRIKSAARFQKSIASTFHPITVSSYCASPKQKSYGEVIWKLEGREDDFLHYEERNPQEWSFVSEDGRGRVMVRTRIGKMLTLVMQEPKHDGDGTVPAERSAHQVRGLKFIHGTEPDGTHYEHQDSYKNREVQASSLWAMVQMALITIEQKWWRKT